MSALANTGQNMIWACDPWPSRECGPRPIKSTPSEPVDEEGIPFTQYDINIQKKWVIDAFKNETKLTADREIARFDYLERWRNRLEDSVLNAAGFVNVNFESAMIFSDFVQLMYQSIPMCKLDGTPLQTGSYKHPTISSSEWNFYDNASFLSPMSNWFPRTYEANKSLMGKDLPYGDFGIVTGTRIEFSVDFIRKMYQGSAYLQSTIGPSMGFGPFDFQSNFQSGFQSVFAEEERKKAEAKRLADLELQAADNHHVSQASLEAAFAHVADSIRGLRTVFIEGAALYDRLVFETSSVLISHRDVEMYKERLLKVLSKKEVENLVTTPSTSSPEKPTSVNTTMPRSETKPASKKPLVLAVIGIGLLAVLGGD